MPPLPLHPLISSDPTVRSGRPYLTGTRLGVADVLDWLGSGQTETALLRDFPDLTSAMVRACLHYSADREHWAY